ncbi:MAG: VWA domain-containing protein, partial [Bacteroidota bacterium]
NNNMFQSIQFVNPIFFLLLLLIPIVGLIAWQRRSKREVNLKMSSLKALEATPSLRGRLRSLLPVLRALAFASLVIAMTRPQSVLQQEEVKAEGIDIMLVMDLSSSMLAQDFKPDRLEVSKAVASEFVRKREYDRMGLVVFAGEAFTQCPLTTDHKVLQEFLASLECGMLEDGTAIGMGLASSVNRLKDSEAESKVVILLTDGDNNAGYIQPITAAEIAQEFGVRVYTIGVGTMGSAYAPVGRLPGNRYRFGLVTVKIDEALLRQISGMTGGKYFRATTNEALQEIYDEIDELEKTEIEVTMIRRYSEKYHIFVFWGLVFLLLEVILRYSVLRAIP